MSKTSAYAYSIIGVALFSYTLVKSTQMTAPDKLMMIVSALAAMANTVSATMAVVNSGKFDSSTQTARPAPIRFLLVAPLIVGAFMMLAGGFLAGIWKPVALFTIFAGTVAGALLGNTYLKGAIP